MTSALPQEYEVPIPHLQRRKIEGRVLIPFIRACMERFGEEATRDLVLATVQYLGRKDGEQWAQRFGSGLAGLQHVAEEVWAAAGGMDIDVLQRTEDRLDFNVTRCAYADFWKELGLADIGALVQCGRDHAIAKGVNPTVELTRTGTIMEGKSCCDFRFRRSP